MDDNLVRALKKLRLSGLLGSLEVRCMRRKAMP